MTDAAGGFETLRFVADAGTARSGARTFVRYSTLHSSAVWLIPVVLVAATFGALKLFPGSWWIAPLILVVAFAVSLSRAVSRSEKTLARVFPVGSETTMVYDETGYWHSGPGGSGFVLYNAYAGVGVAGEWAFLRYPEQRVWRIVPRALVPDAELARFRTG